MCIISRRSSDTGASAVNPYLAQDCIGELIAEGALNKDYYAAIDAYNKAVLDGVVRIASKMGISSMQSYEGAQIFEAVGICRQVVDTYFTNTVSRVGGIGLEEINEAVVWRHDRAFDPMDLTVELTVDSSGFHKLRSGVDMEDHMYNPLTILTLQKAVQTGDFACFRRYSAMSTTSRSRIPCAACWASGLMRKRRSRWRRSSRSARS